ncbi:E3 ubiquitin-protein ligase NEDD4 [Porphyridium purpureum]|uniref:E3 ubiquitin-protein ligase NEDD4 n=1 Tax=Porphyridium purpureum TaxID=35688 RepID=A0A5J4Z804_PORPP|nr:E3 ubiquitin-protein ligase NEDD4 [Porphyridium purpureum]|eukprot:POR8112..scf295_1
MDGTFLIHVVSAYGVASMDTGSKSDPYVKVLLGDCELGKTAVVKNSLSPVWNYKIKVHLKGPESCVHEEALVFEAFDKDRFTRDDFLGIVKIKFDKIISGEINKVHMLGSRPLPHKDKVAGSLTLEFSYVPGADAGAPAGYIDAHAYHWENGKFRPGSG